MLVNLSQHLEYLQPEQAQDIAELIKKHPSLFRDTPGLTDLVSHDVDTPVLNFPLQARGC